VIWFIAIAWLELWSAMRSRRGENECEPGFRVKRPRDTQTGCDQQATIMRNALTIHIVFGQGLPPQGCLRNYAYTIICRKSSLDYTGEDIPQVVSDYT
jgi:hypothetical protein